MVRFETIEAKLDPDWINEHRAQSGTLIALKTNPHYAFFPPVDTGIHHVVEHCFAGDAVILAGNHGGWFDPWFIHWALYQTVGLHSTTCVGDNLYTSMEKMNNPSQLASVLKKVGFPKLSQRNIGDEFIDVLQKIGFIRTPRQTSDWIRDKKALDFFYGAIHKALTELDQNGLSYPVWITPEAGRTYTGDMHVYATVVSMYLRMVERLFGEKDLWLIPTFSKVSPFPDERAVSYCWNLKEAKSNDPALTKAAKKFDGITQIQGLWRGLISALPFTKSQDAYVAFGDPLNLTQHIQSEYGLQEGKVQRKGIVAKDIAEYILKATLDIAPLFRTEVPAALIGHFLHSEEPSYPIQRGMDGQFHIDDAMEVLGGWLSKLPYLAGLSPDMNGRQLKSLLLERREDVLIQVKKNRVKWYNPQALAEYRRRSALQVIGHHTCINYLT